jgi:hypothetical protein
MKDELFVVASITSDQTHDPDDVPTHDGGNCYYWAACEDSPITDVRVFVVFNREPNSEGEAFKAAKDELNPD